RGDPRGPRGERREVGRDQRRDAVGVGAFGGAVGDHGLYDGLESGAPVLRLGAGVRLAAVREGDAAPGQQGERERDGEQEGGERPHTTVRAPARMKCRGSYATPGYRLAPRVRRVAGGSGPAAGARSAQARIAGTGAIR